MALDSWSEAYETGITITVVIEPPTARSAGQTLATFDRAAARDGWAGTP